MTADGSGDTPTSSPGDLAITVVAYEAERFIGPLLERIPATICGDRPLVLISDDASTDRTTELADKWAVEHPEVRLQVRRQPVNLGYGGNQKVGFGWAAAEGARIVVLLHGDEQYPPEMIEELVQPIVAGTADAVFGSRMITRGGARRGGMPVPRFVANIALSRLLNVLAPEKLTEWFSGFRAYRTSALLDVGWDGLPDGFDFDVAITMRMMQHGHPIAEIAIPTHYGTELSRVPLVRTAVAAVRHGLSGRADRHRPPRVAGARTA